MTKARIEEAYFDREPAVDALRTASAAAFGVRPETIVVECLDGPAHIGPEPAVRWLRDGEDMRGEFPVWYYLHTEVADLDRINQILSAITGKLGVAALSQAPDPDDLALHGPDGSLRIVPVEQSSANGNTLVLSPSDRAILERAYKAVRALAS